MKTTRPVLGSRGLGCLLRELRFTCLDIGARGQFIPDLLPLAPAIDGIGFEPDQDECARLNAAPHGRWHSLRFIPTALAETRGSRPLYLYHNRAYTSLYQANVELANAFARADNVLLDRSISVPTMPLDLAAETFDFGNADFVKLDIQGAELEVLRSGPKLLGSTVLALRIEVEFAPLYQSQPLFSDVELYLRNFAFVPMGFLELHHWRRTTRRRYPALVDGPIPYSRGQLMHGDVLFFRDPDSLSDDTPAALESMIKAAILALAYEYVDHASVVLKRSAVMRHLAAAHGVDGDELLSDVSRFLARRHRRTVWTEGLKHFLHGW